MSVAAFLSLQIGNREIRAVSETYPSGARR